jgi:MFS family permease
MSAVADDRTQVAPRPRGLAPLLASTAVSVTGDGMFLAAAPLLAASLTRNPLAVSAVAAAGYVAWFLVGLPAGALVDRWPRRAVLVAADLARAAVLAVLVVLVATEHANVPVVIGAVFLVGVGSCFFEPAAQAAIPTVVGRDKTALSHANGKLWAFDTFGRSLAGPPLGAAAFVAMAALPFGLDAVSFVASALLLSRLPLGRPTVGGHEPVLRAVRAGVVYLARSAELRLLGLGMAAYNFGYNVAFATLVLYVQDVLQLGDFGYGALVATAAVGGIAGGWIGPRIGKRLSAGSVYALALLVQGAAWAAVWLTANPWAAGVALACLGVASTTVSVVGGAARQLLTPDNMLGRITAATRLLGIGSAGLGALAGGLVARVGGVEAPLVVAAVLLGLFSVTFALPRRTV